MAFGSRTYSRSPSVCTTDGIEMKLSEAAKPSQDIYLPQNFNLVQSQVLRNPQYNFQCEHAFLSWTEDIKLKTEERLKEMIRKNRKKSPPDETQAETPQSEYNVNSQVLNGPITNSQITPSQTAVSHAGVSAPPPNVHPALVGIGSDILQPTPSQGKEDDPSDNSISSSTKQFDFSIFENAASDPFEITELQTLNDMEELRNVLANSAPSSNAIDNNVPSNNGITNQRESEEDLCATDDEILEEMSDFTPSTINGIPNGSVTSHIPIASQSHVTSHDSKFDLEVDEGIEMCQSVPDTLSKSLKETDLEVNAQRIHSYPSAVHLSHSPNFSSRTPLPPLNGRKPFPQDETDSTPLVSSLGYPSYHPHIISSSVHIPSRNQDTVLSPPPGYPQNSPSDQTLNRYSPLPPTTQQTSPENSTNDSPYYSLKEDDRQFVDTIVSMGFPQLRTAKAVQRLGQDQRMVFDFLCAMDRLCTKGHKEDKVEHAMALLDNDEEKVSDFLPLWEKIEELGFSVEDIKQQFLEHGSDQDKVLDALTSNS